MDKYKLSVGEPWDFVGPDGENLIIGEVVQFRSPFLVIFKSNSILSIDGIVGRILLLDSRHKRPILKNEAGYLGVVNGWITAIEDYLDKEEEFLIEHSKFVIICTISKL